EIQILSGTGTDPGCVDRIEGMGMKMLGRSVLGYAFEHPFHSGSMLGLQAENAYGRCFRDHFATRFMRCRVYLHRPFHQSAQVSLSPTRGPDLAIDSVRRPRMQ